ncbi:MAG: A/G-specific adenine glycosylase [Proteobacteria bacterium]|nr:A/G-specific adenine glycosylase [Pseudomonadota bacterium]
MTAATQALAARVVAWQRTQGRHDLPWQHSREPYRVWLSEIMLQQTQVATVLGYYPRFLARCPDVAALAAAPLDDVLALWDGLGYYSRARNLHRCAQQVMAQHGGAFPRSAAGLAELPGIGPSTAAAIAAFCFGERAAILDGNVQRVLARALGFEGDLSQAAPKRALWAQAQALLPASPDMPAYTQGLMDLGATVCTTRAPRCAACPLRGDCTAHAQGRELALPVKTRRIARRAQAVWWLHAQRADGALWLVRRPAPGVWGGLWSLPQWPSEAALRADCPPDLPLLLAPTFSHALTHLELHLHPMRAPWPGMADPPLGGGTQGQWVSVQALGGLGLPAALRKTLADCPPTPTPGAA